MSLIPEKSTSTPSLSNLVDQPDLAPDSSTLGKLTLQELNFLTEFANTGQVGHSANQAKLTRQQVYRLRQKNILFGLAYQEAKSISVSILEDAAQELAVNGNVRLITWLLARLEPALYGTKIDITLSTLTNDQVLHMLALSSLAKVSL